jgi:hypothetical protein
VAGTWWRCRAAPRGGCWPRWCCGLGSGSRLIGWIEELWGQRPPRLARKALQMQVSRLRAALEAAAPEAAQVLSSGPGGYRLVVDEQQVDAVRFERLVHEGRDSLARGDPQPARERFEQALALCRGTPLAGLELEGAFIAEVAYLEELRLVAVDQRIAALLADAPRPANARARIARADAVAGRRVGWLGQADDAGGASDLVRAVGGDDHDARAVAGTARVRSHGVAVGA